MSLRRSAAGLALVTVISMSSCASSSTSDGSTPQKGPTFGQLQPDEKATYEYVVPYGTGVKIDRGQTVVLMPSTLDVKVGESIRIVNKDSRDFTVGPFSVKAGQTVAMRFTTVGVLEGVCALNENGRFLINVTA
jgi:plastocyanin